MIYRMEIVMSKQKTKFLPQLKHGVSLVALLGYSTSVLADPASSIGQSKSQSVDLNALYNRGVTWTEHFVNILGAVGVVIGIYLFIHCLIKIHAINEGKEQGSIPLQFIGIVISFIIMSVVAWSFWGTFLVRENIGG